ncbi:MAG: GNAT family N-acetyltransferase [Minicystis sp.]
MSIEVRVHPSIRDIPEDAWDALDGVRGAPFLSHVWLAALEDTGCVGGETGWLPHHLGFWDGDRLVAAAPAYLKENSEGEFVFDWAWASAAERARIPYYPKLIVAVPFTPATASRFLVAEPADRPRLLPMLAQVLRRIVAAGDLSSAHVLFPTEDESKALGEAGLARRYGVQFHWRNEGYKTFDDYLARFSSKRRNQIRRERREMDKQGITISTERGRIAPEIIDVMYGFYLATVEKFTWGRQYLNREFFEEICDKLAGKVEIVLAREGKKILGGAFNLAGESTLYGRYWGAVEERPFMHFNVCFYHSIDECIARGLTRFEPGAGGQHKLVRGFEPAITHSAHHLAHPGLDRAVREFLERERAAIEEGTAQKDVAWK